MKLIKEQLKQEKGSITMTVLAAMLFITSVITISYFSISNQSSDQNQKVRIISEQYDVKNSDIQQKYNQMYDEYVEDLEDKNKIGDINDDDQIDEQDLEILSSYLNLEDSNPLTEDLTEEQKIRCDINKDKSVTQEDYIKLDNMIKSNS